VLLKFFPASWTPPLRSVPPMLQRSFFFFSDHFPDQDPVTIKSPARNKVFIKTCPTLSPGGDPFRLGSFFGFSSCCAQAFFPNGFFLFPLSLGGSVALFLCLLSVPPLPVLPIPEFCFFRAFKGSFLRLIFPFFMSRPPSTTIPSSPLLFSPRDFRGFGRIFFLFLGGKCGKLRVVLFRCFLSPYSMLVLSPPLLDSGLGGVFTTGTLFFAGPPERGTFCPSSRSSFSFFAWLLRWSLCLRLMIFVFRLFSIDCGPNCFSALQITPPSLAIWAGSDLGELPQSDGRFRLEKRREVDWPPHSSSPFDCFLLVTSLPPLPCFPIFCRRDGGGT